MRCISLIATGTLYTVGGSMYGHGAHYHIEPYPQPENGIKLDPTTRAVNVGFKERVFASRELLQLDPSTGAICRNGSDVTVLRCSVDIVDGKPVLVPEKPGDENDALVFIDVGSGRHTFVRYELDEQKQLVCHSRSDNEPYRQRMLVRLKPFDAPILALRSSQKWVFWGEERVKESLVIQFDGKTVFYDIRRPTGN